MPIKRVSSDERREYRDPVTGAKVIQLTQSSGDDFHLYFTATSYLADGRRIAFRSDRTGQLEQYTLDLHTGEICQLTDDGISKYYSSPDLTENVIYYATDTEIRRVDADTGEVETICKVPKGFVTQGLDLGGNGRYLVFNYTEPKRDLVSSDGTNRLVRGMPSDANERCFSRPLSMFMSWDLQENIPDAIWGEHRFMDHPQLSPTDSDVVIYCHCGAQAVTRTWAVQRGEVRQKQPWAPYPEPAGWRACHEFFCEDGRIAFQLDDERNGGIGFRSEPDDLPDAACYQAFVDPDGGNFRKYLLPGPRPGHFNCHTEFGPVVGDRNPLGKELGEVNAGMVLMRHDADSGKALCEPLCTHNSSWDTQPSHPHPIISPDGEWVLYSSDCDGTTNVYMVSIGDVAAKLGF
jgi:oligogalacturonide lyase